MSHPNRRSTDRPREEIRNWRPLALMLLLIAIAMTCSALLGCALAPNAVRLQGEHMSHASQHVDGSGQNMGAELVGVVAHWQLGGWFVNAEESYNLSPADGHSCVGGICGEREVFQAQAGYEWRISK